MTILWQNEHFVVVEKPAGWLSVPSRFFDKDQRPVLGLQLQSELKTKIFPVHRLDFEVSGIALFALTAKAHQEAGRLFENRGVEKIYHTLTDRKPPEDLEVGAVTQWKCRLLMGKKRAFESEHGKPSLTNAKFLGQRAFEGQNLFSWHLEPKTGRAHQLRYEMYRHQIPIYGDTLYSGSKYKDSEILLRAISLKF